MLASMAALLFYPFLLTQQHFITKTHSLTKSIPSQATTSNRRSFDQSQSQFHLLHDHRISLRTCAMATTASDGGFDREAAVKQFDESRTGVKGLVDAGVTEIPSMFRHNPDPLPPAPTGSVSVPTVDLSLPRGVVMDKIRSASHEWGFFQVTAISYDFVQI